MTNLTKLPSWADKTHIYAVVENSSWESLQTRI